MSNKYFLFNGPPGCGKDTIVDYITKHFGFKKEKFAQPLKDGLQFFFGLTDEEMVYYDSFGIKDMPQERLYDVVPRKFQINLSQDFFKPTVGNDVFGKLLYERTRLGQDEKYAISDSGFREEAMFIIDRVGRENVKLFRVVRDGCNFDNDSRDYIDLPCETVTIENNKGLYELYRELETLFR